MNIKTILLFCFIAISVAIADDTEKNTENEDEQFQQPPPPSFAKGASADAVKQLQEIYADPSQTKQELFDRVEAWANEQGSEIAVNEQFQQPPPPSFAKGASADAIKQLQEIYADPSQTKQELFDRVEAWANEQGSEIAAKYYQYIEEAENYHKKLVAKLSDAKIDAKLKGVIERILDMGEDKSKTIQDELAAVKRIQDSLSPEQLAEVSKFLFSADE
uniref:ANIS5_cation-bd domain-containing protein n=1 Tax=Ascaris lumbricoides TaxID=6252 RepID=A0A0M3I331_ASCLU